MCDYHEPTEELSKKARSCARALNSLKEEIEAVDWYGQRVDVEDNKDLKEIMAHNMHEEMEHAVMTFEWLRRNMEGWDEMMKKYLFTKENLLKIEEKKD